MDRIRMVINTEGRRMSVYIFIGKYIQTKVAPKIEKKKHGRDF